MNSRQTHILRMLSSITVGTIAFCLTLPVVILLGAILLEVLVPIESDAFFPPELAILFLSSALAGLGIGIYAGIKYYRYMGKGTDG